MGGAEIPCHILRLAEAFVFASAEPVTEAMLRPLLPEAFAPREVLDGLRRRCADRGVVLFEAGGGWAFRTAPDIAPQLQTSLTARRRVPRAAMEVLAIIALHQPVTRAEIEQIRGVSLAQLSMDSLMEAGLITPCGSRETPGRPTLWATTPRFLAQFSLTTLDDLPGSHLFSAGLDRAAGTETEDDGGGASRAVAGAADSET